LLDHTEPIRRSEAGAVLVLGVLSHDPLDRPRIVGALVGDHSTGTVASPASIAARVRRRVPRDEFVAIWVETERRVEAQSRAQRGDAYTTGVARTCRWLATAFVPTIHVAATVAAGTSAMVTAVPAAAAVGGPAFYVDAQLYRTVGTPTDLGLMKSVGPGR
jgi:hypothetical protein